MIDKQSPLYGLQSADLRARGTILIVSLDGIEGLLAQTGHTRHPYATDEIVFGKRFADMVRSDPNGARLIDYTRFHDPVDLPTARSGATAPDAHRLANNVAFDRGKFVQARHTHITQHPHPG